MQGPLEQDPSGPDASPESPEPRDPAPQASSIDPPSPAPQGDRPSSRPDPPGAARASRKDLASHRLHDLPGPSGGTRIAGGPAEGLLQGPGCCNDLGQAPKPPAIGGRRLPKADGIGRVHALQTKEEQKNEKEAGIADIYRDPQRNGRPEAVGSKGRTAARGSVQAVPSGEGMVRDEGGLPQEAGGTGGTGDRGLQAVSSEGGDGEEVAGDSAFARSGVHVGAATSGMKEVVAAAEEALGIEPWTRAAQGGQRNLLSLMAQDPAVSFGGAHRDAGEVSWGSGLGTGYDSESVSLQEALHVFVIRPVLRQYSTISNLCIRHVDLKSSLLIQCAKGHSK